ncbi:acyltransferase family protein [Vibrio sp. LaRot3]|uniref:acyltransferase family protein n=1 Tax=Vibrio sp. LaRot3 TaxID=2998829 RepID=UPI0022CDC4DA|nr:acyltransferase [Vibrio sp. LaRot3]MDA0147677.1 acyltransferase [Vibrio sp. LaRot3]
MNTQTPSNLPLLTSLRGFAALFVTLYHARLILFPQYKQPIADVTQFLENGYLWVDLFFILSGYVMIHVYQQGFKQGVTFENWWRFMSLRFSRVYPLFLVTLLALIGWESYKAMHTIPFYAGPLFESWGMIGNAPFEGPFNRGNAIMANLLMMQSMDGGMLSWNISSWSLSIEWLIYLFFPLFAVMLFKPAAKSLLTPALCLILIFSMASQAASLDYTKHAYGFIRGCCGFLLGAWMCSRKDQLPLNKLQGSTWLLVIIASLFAAMHFKATTLTLMITYFLLVLLVGIGAIQTNSRTWLMKVIDNRITQYLGDVSYSLYLWHAVILLAGVEIVHRFYPEPLDWWYQQQDWQTGFLVIAVFIALSLIVSSLSYHLIERPAQRLIRKRIKANKSLNQSIA